MSKKNILYLSILLGLSILLWLPRFRGPIDLRYDGAVYYIAGTALAEGKGYRLLNYRVNLPLILSPPLLSLFVAAQQKVLGTSDPMRIGHALRLSFFFLFILYIASVYRLATYYLASGYAFLVALLSLFS